MNLVASSDMDHVSYILIIFSISFMVFLFSNIVIGIYDRLANPTQHVKIIDGRAMENGHMRDAAQYELDDLVSDEEGDESRAMLRRSDDENGSHSTMGRNNETVAH